MDVSFQGENEETNMQVKEEKEELLSLFFVLSLIKSNLLTADPRLSVHPPKQDVDFFICCGR